jgi:hypothetical protein
MAPKAGKASKSPKAKAAAPKPKSNPDHKRKTPGEGSAPPKRRAPAANAASADNDDIPIAALLAAYDEVLGQPATPSQDGEPALPPPDSDEWAEAEAEAVGARGDLRTYDPKAIEDAIDRALQGMRPNTLAAYKTHWVRLEVCGRQVRVVLGSNTPLTDTLPLPPLPGDLPAACRILTKLPPSAVLTMLRRPWQSSTVLISARPVVLRWPSWHAC